MAVDGTTVSTPAELKATIEKSQPNSKVRFKVWRNEESFTKEIQLAQRSDEVPECHRAWLGVVLTSARRSNGTGVELAHVFPNSPAEQSGLQQGDVILKADDRDVSNIDSLLQCMENHGPDAACVLAVERNGEVQNIPIKLGNLDRAPYEWMVNAFRAPLDATELNDTQNDDNRVDGDVRELIQSLRQEVAELRQQIEKPAGIESRDPSRDRSGEQPRQNAQPGERPNDRNSRIEDARTKVQLVAVASPSPTPQTVTVQQNRQYRGQGNRYYPPTNNNYRYGYRDYSMGRYPNNSGWYYNYGGSSRYAPSYNRGAYFYGPRFGVRVGPSWGTYWY